jgi:hypothetical protein
MASAVRCHVSHMRRPVHCSLTLLLHSAGIVWGWAVAAVAFLPYALWVLTHAAFGRALGVALWWLAGTMVPLALADRLYYGRWTVRPASPPNPLPLPLSPTL